MGDSCRGVLRVYSPERPPLSATPSLPLPPALRVWIGLPLLDSERNCIVSARSLDEQASLVEAGWDRWENKGSADDRRLRKWDGWGKPKLWPDSERLGGE